MITSYEAHIALPYRCFFHRWQDDLLAGPMSMSFVGAGPRLPQAQSLQPGCAARVGKRTLTGRRVSNRSVGDIGFPGGVAMRCQAGLIAFLLLATRNQAIVAGERAKLTPGAAEIDRWFSKNSRPPASPRFRGRTTPRSFADKPGPGAACRLFRCQAVRADTRRTNAQAIDRLLSRRLRHYMSPSRGWLLRSSHRSQHCRHSALSNPGGAPHSRRTAV